MGLQVREAREQSIAVKSFTVMIQDVDRAITDDQDYGFAKIHLRHGSDQILGAAAAFAEDQVFGSVENQRMKS